MISNIIDQAKSAKRKIQEIITGEEPVHKDVKKRKMTAPTRANSTNTIASKAVPKDAEVARAGSKKLQKRSVGRSSSTASKSSPLRRADSRSTINRMRTALKPKANPKTAPSTSSPTSSRSKSASVAKASVVKTTAASVRSRVERSVRGVRRSQATLASVNGGLSLVGSSSSTIRIIGGHD